MKKLSIILCMGFWLTSHAQTHQLDLAQQHPDTVKAELKALFQELSIKHPGFYRYNEKAEFDTYIDSIVSSIQQPLTELGILRKAKPIVAKIGCLHTGIHLSAKTDSMLNVSANCLPFTLHFDKGKARVWKSFDEKIPIKTGSTISKINGRPIHTIYKELLNHIPMDGLNETGKYKLLQYTFPEWYRNIIEVAAEFEVELENGERYKVAAIKADETFGYKDIVNQPMSLQVIEDIAVIKIPSFANSYLKSHNQKFKKTMKSFFRTIEVEKIETLLLDLRGNAGGSDSNPAWLMAQFPFL